MLLSEFVYNYTYDRFYHKVMTVSTVMSNILSLFIQSLENNITALFLARAVICSKFFVFGFPHNGETEKAADGVGNRFCEENALYAKPHCWQNKCERNNADDLSQKGEENRFFALSQRLKCRLPRKLKGHEEKAEKV